MKDVRDWLREGDPIVNEPPLADTAVQRMRHAIATAEESQPVFADWARGSWAAATVVAAVTIVVGLSRWMEHPRNVLDVHPVAMPSADRVEIAAPRQVHLIAPRGTRVIWIFNDEFTP